MTGDAGRRRICVFTATRAEYGLLYWLLRELDACRTVELQILVSGSHLAPDFGRTVQAVEEDGFRVSAAVEMLLASDTPVGVVKSMGVGLIGFADAFDRLRPDLLVVLGDRYEALAAAAAALIAGIPIAHIAGGESSEGAVDEAIRHAITKIAHVHFTAAEPYRTTLVDQLGEEPWRVHNVGALGMDNVRRSPLLDRAEVASGLRIRWGQPTLLVTYHPVTLEAGGSEDALTELFAALDEFPDAATIFTMPNADAGGRVLARMVRAYVSARPGRAYFFTSLGRRRYLSLLAHSDVVVGNSSSGLVEAPAVGTPTVDVGNRQEGRVAIDSVIHCAELRADIVDAVRLAISPEFRGRTAAAERLYGPGDAARRIRRILAALPLEGLLVKRLPQRDVHSRRRSPVAGRTAGCGTRPAP